MRRVLAGTALGALLIAGGGSLIACQHEPTYSEGYRYGRERLTDVVPSHGIDDGGMCGEYADSEGLAVSDAWFRGCEDGALGRPSAE